MAPATGPSQPGILAANSSVQLETDAEYLFQSEIISNPHQKIEYANPADISNFALALRDLAYGRRDEPVRILHYGDSILTTDELSGRVRYILQRKFGDAGHGFVLLAKPWQWYHHLGIDQGGTIDKWKIRPFTSAPLKDGLYGLGGVAFLASRGGSAKAWIQTAAEGEQGRHVRTFDISYLEQPDGGSFNVYTDNQMRVKIDTSGDEKLVKHAKISVKLGPSKLKIESNNDGVLRLFGVILETEESGVVYDSLAINGARATALARFDEAHWQQVMRYRDPSLIIIMMGANEGANQFLNLKQYRKDFAEILKTVKSASTEASCLVVGPLDQATKVSTGRLGSKKMPAKLSRAQREVAFASGCAFFDTYQAMGGDRSMAKWATSGLGGGDLIHPTKNGAQKLGNWLAEALLYAYQTHGKKTRGLQ
ncbi:MAG: hypothetical protein JXX29_00840 [Deltaproteobacteria bacterium]|nr:hypothetical protein [Deltaproteobacteria bacterium]MBN2670184.1 hypothetical protein [Deltaproteobacteria bacterium]